MPKNTTEQVADDTTEVVEFTVEELRFLKAFELAEAKRALPLTDTEAALVAEVTAAVPGELPTKEYTTWRQDTPERVYGPGTYTDPKGDVAAMRAALLRFHGLSVFKTANVLGFNAPADVFAPAKRGATMLAAIPAVETSAA